MNTILEKLLRQKTGLSLGINKCTELSRLVYEIYRREGILPESLLNEPAFRSVAERHDLGPLNKFALLKARLVARRYPQASLQDDFAVSFSRLSLPLSGSTRASCSLPFVPERIVIEENMRRSALASRITGLFPTVQPQYVASLNAYRRAHPGTPHDLRKRDLYIARQHGDFVKPCPCTKNVRRCNYHIINLGFGCPFDCSYCYLQQYANFPGIVLDANMADYLEPLDAYCAAFAGKPLRIGTGEFTDSLALDHLTEYSKVLVPFFAERGALFELKTKSANIGNLLSLGHRGKTVVSWSLNPEKIVAREELGAASLAERLEAAKICAAHGYPVAFHFDPVIAYDGWQKEYEQVVNALFDAVAGPAWISIGSLRFHRSLKNVIEHRFPAADYIYGEMITAADKKTRYYAALREEIYRAMAGWIRRRSKTAPVYLCMESADMWQKIFGGTVPWWMQKER